MNLKVTPSFKDRFRELAKERGVGMGELAEMILDEWEALGGER